MKLTRDRTNFKIPKEIANSTQSSEFSFIEQLNRGVSGSTLGFKSKSDHHLMRVIFIAGVRKLKALVPSVPTNGFRLPTTITLSMRDHSQFAFA